MTRIYKATFILLGKYATFTSCCESMRPLHGLKSMRPLQSIATHNFQPPIAYAYCLLPITSCENMRTLQSIATNQFQPPIHLGTDVTAEGGQISYMQQKSAPIDHDLCNM